MLIMLSTLEFQSSVYRSIGKPLWKTPRTREAAQSQCAFEAPLISGVQAQAFRDHLSMHSARLDESSKFRKEIVDVWVERSAGADAEATINSSKPPEKCQGKGSGTDKKDNVTQGDWNVSDVNTE